MNTEPILLVEDDENDVFFFRNAYNKTELPNSLHVVADGQKAVDYLGGTGHYVDRTVHPLPGLVLLDLNLPCKTGFEVLTWIREHPTLRTLLVVILTSSSAETDAHRAYTLGTNSYVVKPSNPNDLQALLNLMKLYWLGWNFPPIVGETEAKLDRPA